ncbi:hypothetical protein AHF37_11244 [Paragonimus kellicotti]|nr:hypothetical protein AHF37_11244 [Paragonimus kellicotti]
MLLPKLIPIVVLEVTGADLIEVLENAVSQYLQKDWSNRSWRSSDVSPMNLHILEFRASDHLQSSTRTDRS